MSDVEHATEAEGGDDVSIAEHDELSEWLHQETKRYSKLIAECGSRKQWEAALACLPEMIGRKLEPNVYSLSADEALALLEEMRHGTVGLLAMALSAALAERLAGGRRPSLCCERCARLRSSQMQSATTRL